MMENDLGFIHLRFENESVVEGHDASERICLLCTVNDVDIPVEVPAAKIPILRDRVKPYLKERGIAVPSIPVKSSFRSSSQEKRIQTLIQLINENINDSADLKDVVVKFLDLRNASSTTLSESEKLRSAKKENKPNMISPEDSADVTNVLQSDWSIDFNDLDFIRQAGQGAFGRIYKARYRGTYVAVKEFQVSEVSDDLLKEMKYEVSIMSGLRHPNIVLYIGASLQPPNVGMVTEWCENGSLADYLHDFSKPLNGRMAVQLALEVSQGMEYLQGHHNGIIHRDLKSDNILLGRHFEAKVADFGLTVIQELELGCESMRSCDRVVTAEERSDHPPRDLPEHPSNNMSEPTNNISEHTNNTSEHANNTSPSPKNRMSLRNMLTNPRLIDGDVADDSDFYGMEGTIQWMAPEIMNGSKYNSRVDIYSYGILLTELLARIVPFSDTYAGFDFINDVATKNQLPTIPKWVKCYEKDPLYLAGWSVLKKHHPDLEYHNIPNDLKTLILQCTLMNAQLRPPFKAITETLLSLTELSPLLFLHSFDMPRIRANLQDARYEKLALRELLILLTHVLVPCPTCAEEVARDQAAYEEYLVVFIPELMRLVVPIIHKEREVWRKSDVLGLGVRAALELLRFFCVIPVETVTALMKDIMFVLASYIEEEESVLTLSDVCSMCMIVNMCYTQCEVKQKREQAVETFRSWLQTCLSEVGAMEEAGRRRLYTRLADWIPKECLEGIDGKEEQNEVKEERIRETVRSHIILLQNKFQMRLLK